MCLYVLLYCECFVCMCGWFCVWEGFLLGLWSKGFIVGGGGGCCGGCVWVLELCGEGVESSRWWERVGFLLICFMVFGGWFMGGGYWFCFLGFLYCLGNWSW